MSADRGMEELRRHWDRSDTRRQWSKRQTGDELRQTRRRAESERLNAQNSGRTQAPRKRSRRVPRVQPHRTPLQILMALRARIAMDIDFGRQRSQRSYLRDRVLPELDQIISDLRARGLT